MSVVARSSALSRLGRTPWMMLLVVSIMSLFPGYASAAQHMHGVVLAVTPKTGQAIVRHDAFGSMPAMTMSFRVVPRERAAQLQAGATIDADVDTATEPWTLSHVNSTSAQSLTSDVGLFRHVTPLKVGDPAPDTAFVDQRGAPFRLSDFRGKDVVMAFIYTRCQDARMCPLISADFRKVQELVAKRDDVRLVEVSLDPTYDRPPVLARYAATFGADPNRWKIVVGDAEPTLNFAAQFGVTAFADPQNGIIHAENTVLIDPQGRIRRMITETSWIPSEITAAIESQHGRASNPIDQLNLWISAQAVALCGNSAAGFNGLQDLFIVLGIFVLLGYLVYRLARGIFKAAA